MEIFGRVVADAALRSTKTGKEVVGFTIAINHAYKTKEGERREETTYVECAYWAAPAIREYVTKGTLVELYGRMAARAYINRDGEAVGVLTFHTLQIKFWGRSGKVEKEPEAVAEAAEAGTDDLPF